MRAGRAVAREIVLTFETETGDYIRVVAAKSQTFFNYFVISASCLREPANVEFEPVEKWQEQAGKAAVRP